MQHNELEVGGRGLIALAALCSLSTPGALSIKAQDVEVYRGTMGKGGLEGSLGLPLP